MGFKKTGQKKKGTVEPVIEPESEEVPSADPQGGDAALEDEVVGIYQVHMSPEVRMANFGFEQDIIASVGTKMRKDYEFHQEALDVLNKMFGTEITKDKFEAALEAAVTASAQIASDINKYVGDRHIGSVRNEEGCRELVAKSDTERLRAFFGTLGVVDHRKRVKAFIESEMQQEIEERKAQLQKMLKNPQDLLPRDQKIIERINQEESLYDSLDGVDEDRSKAIAQCTEEDVRLKHRFKALTDLATIQRQKPIDKAELWREACEALKAEKFSDSALMHELDFAAPEKYQPAAKVAKSPIYNSELPGVRTGPDYVNMGGECGAPSGMPAEKPYDFEDEPYADKQAHIDAAHERFKEAIAELKKKVEPLQGQ